MNENNFDFFSDSELSQIMSTIPPDDNITKNISPWRKATRQMLIGFALTAVVPQIFPLNLILPVAGSISLFLGFRSLRKENRWFFFGFIISSIILGFRAVSIFLNSSIVPYTVQSSAPITAMAMVSLLLIFMTSVSISVGFIGVKRKLEYSASSFSPYALVAIMGLLIVLAFINFTGILATLVLVAYVLIFVFLIKLSKELDEIGYSIEIASNKTSDKSVVAICLSIFLAISLTGYVFFSRYPMEWKPQVKNESVQIEEIKTNLLSLGFPADVLCDITDEDILKCENAVCVKSDTEHTPFNSGRKVYRTVGNTTFTYTEYDKKELQFTTVYALIDKEENEWKVFHHFHWVVDNGYYETEGISVNPPNSNVYITEDISGKVLYNSDGVTYTSPFYKEGNQVYTSNSIFSSVFDTYFAEFSYPLEGEHKRGYATYSVKFTDTRVSANSFINYAHKVSPFQHPVKSSVDILKEWPTDNLSFKVKQHVVLLDLVAHIN